MGVACGRRGGVRGREMSLGKPDGKGPLDRLRRRCEDNIKQGLKEIVCDVGTRFIWLKTGTSSWLMWTR